MRVQHIFCDHCKREIERAADAIDLLFALKNPDAEYPNPHEIRLDEEVCSIACAMAMITNAIERRPRGSR